jgi:acyl-homoserine-lactone acylase
MSRRAIFSPAKTNRRKALILFQNSSAAMKFIFLLSFFSLPGLVSSAQTIDPASIDIVRDPWGVPHIFAKTDAGVAFGLAWANAEDDFSNIQKGIIIGKTMQGRVTGKAGATIDYLVQALGCRDLVERDYEEKISPAFKAVLQGYCDGINAYAAAHPREVALKKLFPVTPKDMVTYSVLELALLSGADQALGEIYNGSVPLATLRPGGSNAYAFNSRITTDGHTYLAINSHQPLEGQVAWYEAHLCSEEGWNILGALFPGAPTILHGCNEYLGWAHTVNSPDKLDTYQLELNPANNKQYRFDNRWIPLEEKTVKLKVKWAGLTIGVKKQIYTSVYGPTLLTRKGAFSIRTGALMDIRPLEQWYRMNKARNFTAFKTALEMNAIAGFNIVYADRYDTIFYISNAKLPLRNPAYPWTSTLPGNTSKTLWNTFHPLRDLPQLLQPSSGYLFNSNNTPFNASAARDNLRASQFDPTMGYETSDNNRSLRFMELMRDHPRVGYDDFKKIKYDLQLPKTLAYQTSSDTLFMLSEKDHPALAGLIHTLTTWDKKATVGSEGAALFAILYYKVVDDQRHGVSYQALTKRKSIELLQYAKDYMQVHFGKTHVTLGEYQKLVRGTSVIPLPGIPDVISAMRSVPFKDGMVKGEQGESYIELVDFTPQGPLLESVNCYGASNRPESAHYADQMDMFVHQKTKRMTLDKASVYKNSARTYHPQLP